MRYVLCYLMRASYATFYATSGVLLGAKSDYVCYLIRASYATYATSGVLLGAKSDVHQRGRRLRLRQVPHTLRMLPHTCPIRYVCYLIRASYATYIREVGASDFVRCLIRYVCYLIHASYSMYATSYVSHTLISSFTASYTNSLRPHTLIAKGVIH
jgi:hypothetical protein